jgi:predicted enzyme related to lactoylglutathione lyase
MSDHLGQFVWYEWMGVDLERAAEFYGHVLGWKVGDPGMAPFPYKIGSVEGYGVAGMLTTPPDAKGMPPCWTGYVAVENVDAAVEKIKEHGGRSMRPPWDIPNIGRAAVVADKQGAPFMLFRPNEGAEMPAPPAPHTPGLVGWRELHAADGTMAMDFFSGLFGWREEGRHDMGPMGIYRLYKAGDQEGGMMTKSPQGPGPCWLFYFLVEAADAANARVVAKGGKVLHGPHEVPGGMFATQCVDAEGAMFGLVSAKR